MASLIVLILMMGVMYAILIVPQQRKMKRHQAFVAALAVGDEVMTSSGVYGTITDLEDDVVHLAVDEGVIIRVARGAIQRYEHEDDVAPAARADDDEEELVDEDERAS